MSIARIAFYPKNGTYFFLIVIEQAVVYLRFENIYKDNILVDESQQHNNAKIVNFARIARFSETCGNGVDLNGGDILLSGAAFHNKPRVAVTIAAWIKLFSVEGLSLIHISEPTRRVVISYAVFCLKKKK